MRPILALACGLALALTPIVASAADQGSDAQPTVSPSPGALHRGLAGRWAGALGYRDYQTDRLFEIPVATTIVQVPDGVTQIRTSLFDDGPGKPVWITSVNLHDEAAGSVSSASYRAGRPVELTVERVRVSEWRDDAHWTITWDSVAEDDNQPAEIRVTETRDGDSLLSVKTVRPLGADDAAWRFRNQTRLTRVSD
ncbi:hypothetical protein [Brevundimonas sp. Root1423]|uniref:hypothetical protein n=1 Tax=Brevundimonas sp. Root1423 TaxID=1736462 RepID=UPI0006F4F8C6|nr:hypothetical protein [Brevundimonas sp. Root1423]KQY84729.1 hypothetical protein ASD25_06790 [Brevundimonas sp. Root1423]